MPGGRVHRTDHWLVEPFPVGTLIVKPERHVTSVADLTDDEAGELGPLLRQASAVARDLTGAEQVYNSLWSHAGPGHIHYVVQPVTRRDMERLGTFGPSLQVALFDRGDAPPADDVERLAEPARALFA